MKRNMAPSGWRKTHDNDEMVTDPGLDIRSRAFLLL